MKENIYRVSLKKGGLRILNRFDSYCLKEHSDGSKLGKNNFNMAWQYLIMAEILNPPFLWDTLYVDGIDTSGIIK